MAWPWRMFRRRNRDLSEIYEGELEITIEGIGTQCMIFERDTLASHVALVQLYRGHGDKGIIIGDVRKSPWEVISFDREAGKLVVRPV